jgi:HlyD family secretion protein
MTAAAGGLDRLESEFSSQISVKAVRASARRHRECDRARRSLDGPQRSLARISTSVALIAAVSFSTACRGGQPDGPLRASGYVEATEVRVAPEVGGRVLEIKVDEGDRVTTGMLLARLDTSDTEIAVRRVEAERAQALAQLRLLQAGARPEEIRQARAQAESAQADVAAVDSELRAANEDVARFEALLASKAGSRKQRDDAVTRQDVAAARVEAAKERVRAANEAVARLKAGARREELAAAQARIDAVDAQLASLRKNLADANLVAPVGGIVTSRLMDAGEIVNARAPVVVVTDLDRAWANVYVDEPVVPRLKLGQDITLVTDARQRINGKITFISPKAEFTPRNVQTAEERTKLVFRIKVTTDNRDGILKTGMPVEAEIPQ